MAGVPACSRVGVADFGTAESGLEGVEPTLTIGFALVETGVPIFGFGVPTDRVAVRGAG